VGALRAQLRVGLGGVAARGRRIDDWTVAWIVAGSQFPDLVDKTLAWSVGVLSAGRSLAHSALTAGVVSTAVLLIAVRRGRTEWGLAFTAAYASHLIGDALPKLAEGNYQDLALFLWPVLRVPGGDGVGSVLLSLRELAASPVGYLAVHPARAAILVALVVVWTADGFPGIVGPGRYLSVPRARVRL